MKDWSEPLVEFEKLPQKLGDKMRHGNYHEALDLVREAERLVAVLKVDVMHEITR